MRVYRNQAMQQHPKFEPEPIHDLHGWGQSWPGIADNVRASVLDVDEEAPRTSNGGIDLGAVHEHAVRKARSEALSRAPLPSTFGIHMRFWKGASAVEAGQTRLLLQALRGLSEEERSEPGRIMFLFIGFCLKLTTALSNLALQIAWQLLQFVEPMKAWACRQHGALVTIRREVLGALHPRPPTASPPWWRHGLSSAPHQTIHRHPFQGRAPPSTLMAASA